LNEQGLATLIASTQSDTALNTIGDLGADTSYFGNTKLATENTLEQFPAASSESKVAKKSESASAVKPDSNELDFDLESMGLQGLEVPNTIPRPASSEPSIDLDSIDFDFLQEPNVVAQSPAEKPAPATIPNIDLELDPASAGANPASAGANPAVDTRDLGNNVSVAAPSLSLELPELEESEDSPVAGPLNTEAASADSLDFDLSEISLNLDPVEEDSKPELTLDANDTFSTSRTESPSTNAEMATKLDLAMAYQEIGDKEGARELLDEVIKGGSAEQSEKARSLLLELA
jgi:pilus assembly protein FimV